MLGVVLVGALALRLALVVLLRNKPTHDLQVFVSWAQLLMQYGAHHLYQHVDTIDHFAVNYPPLFALILAAVDAVYERTMHGGVDLVRLGMLLKLPAIAADLVLCALAFRIVRRWAGPPVALGAAVVAAFAPSTWPISAIWGQVDSIASAFMLLALALLFERRFAWAWCALALAVLVKPLPIIVAPLILAVQLRAQGWSLRPFVGPLCAIVIAYLVSLPFAPTAAPIGVIRWLANEYAIGQSLSHWTSVNAYNIWTLAGAPTPDLTTVLGLTLHAWGWIAFAAVLVPITWMLYHHLGTQMDRSAQEQFVTRAWFVVLVAFFIFETRMHERYILFALALAPLMWYCGRLERRVAATFIVTFTACVILVLGFYEHSWMKENAAITHLLSLINVAAFAVAAVSYFTEATRAPYDLVPGSSRGTA